MASREYKIGCVDTVSMANELGMLECQTECDVQERLIQAQALWSTPCICVFQPTKITAGGEDIWVVCSRTEFHCCLLQPLL